MPSSTPLASPARAPAPIPARVGPLIPLGPVKLDPAKAPARMPISELRADRPPAPAAAPDQPAGAATTEPETTDTPPEQPLVKLAMEIFNAKIVDVRKKE
jgi:hypothetical protein